MSSPWIRQFIKVIFHDDRSFSQVCIWIEWILLFRCENVQVNLRFDRFVELLMIKFAARIIAKHCDRSAANESRRASRIIVEDVLKETCACLLTRNCWGLLFSYLPRQTLWKVRERKKITIFRNCETLIWFSLAYRCIDHVTNIALVELDVVCCEFCHQISHVSACSCVIG